MEPETRSSTGKRGALGRRIFSHLTCHSLEMSNSDYLGPGVSS